MVQSGSNDNGNGQHTDRPALPPVTTVRPSLDPRLLDPTGSHKKPLSFPGYDGIPFRGVVPDLKESDQEQPQVGSQVYVNILDLSNAEDLDYYGKISQLVGNGFAQISFEERQFIQEKGSWLVLIRWMLHYAYMAGQGGRNGQVR